MIEISARSSFKYALQSRTTFRTITTTSATTTTITSSGSRQGESSWSFSSLNHPNHLISGSPCNNRCYSSSSPSFSSSSSSSPSPSSTPSSPARRLKIPTAKAKASASRALREKVITGNPVSNRSKLTGNQSSILGSLESIGSSSSSSIPTSSVELPLSSSQFDKDGNLILVNPLLRDVVAYATSESYDFDALIKSGRLPKGWNFLDEEVIHVPAWPVGSNSSSSSVTSNSTAQSQSQNPTASITSNPNLNVGDAFIFRSGSYVTWGMEEEQSKRFRRNVILGREGSTKAQAQDIGPVEGNKYESIGDETMEYLIDVTQPTRIVGDVLVIGQAPTLESETSHSENNSTSDQTNQSQSKEQQQNQQNNQDTSSSEDWSPLLARLAFSQGLTRSARLSVQESILTNYLSEVSPLPLRLEKFGKVPLGRKEVIRKLGSLLKQRQIISLGRDNFMDEPEVYWENWKIEKHYRDICETLDIEIRFKSINEKLNQAENLLEILRALLTEASSHRMELIIIALIALEATLAFDFS